MRSLNQLSQVRIDLSSPALPKSDKLLQDALDILREERDRLQKENAALRLKILGHDKQVAGLTRSVRAATDDADAYLEAVSALALVVTNEKREWRAAREQARKLLESRGVQPPSTLGSSRQRSAKTKSTKTKTSESS